MCSTVGLLVACPSPWTTKLLRFTPPGICYKQSAVVLCQDVLDLLLASLINICSGVYTLGNKYMHVFYIEHTIHITS